MMRILGLLGLLILAVGIGLAIRFDPGYAIFAYGPWEIEAPLWFVVLGVVVVSLSWRFIEGTFVRIVGWTDHLFILSKEQRTRRANQQTMQALLAYQKQNWSHSEKLFLQGAHYSEAPLLNYLYAAYSAGQQKAYARAQDYFERAHRLRDPFDWLVDLARAEQLYDQGEYRESLALAQNLRPKVPLSIRLLRLLHRLYEHFEHFDDLLHLLNDLVSLGILNETQAQETRVRIYTHSIQRLKNHPGTSAADLAAFWKRVPLENKNNRNLFAVYIKALIKIKAESVAEKLLIESLMRQWDSSLLALFILLPPVDINRRLSNMEGWLKEHPQDEMLLSVLGQLCVTHQLWGKAQEYFEAALAIKETTFAYSALGNLLLQLGQTQEAARIFQRGLDLALQSEKAGS